MKPRSLKTNFIINTLGSIAPLLISLATVPLYMRQIGDARYGVLSIVWVLLGYFGFLDLGLSRAAANALARLKGASREERSKVFVTAFAMHLALGLVGSLCVASIGGYLLQHVLKIPETLKPEIAQAFPWVVCLFPLALISCFGIGVLEARESFLLLNVIQVVSTAAGQIVPVILAFVVGPSLTVVIPAAFVARAASMVALLAAAHHHEGPLTWRALDASQAKKLLGYGGWVTASSLVNPILLTIDQFVIGTILNIGVPPQYVVQINLVSRTQLFPNAFVRAIFPRLSSLAHEDAHSLSLRAQSYLSVGYGALCAPAMILTPLFFKYWINPEFAAGAAPVAQILFVGAWFSCTACIPCALLQGQGRPDITGKFHIFELLPFIAILWVLTSYFGVLGAAIAWSLRAGIDALLFLKAGRMLNASRVTELMAYLSILLTSFMISRVIGDNLIVALESAVLIFMAVILIGFFYNPETLKAFSEWNAKRVESRYKPKLRSEDS